VILHSLIATHFNGDELKDLATKLNGRWDYIFTEDDRTQDRALALVMWVQKHGLTRNMTKLLQEERPGVEWPE
jgi:hypothetical protein